MTVFYSPHYTSEVPTGAVSGIAPDSPAIKVEPGFRHATLRHTHALVDLTNAGGGAGNVLESGDVIRMFSMRSGDRLISLPLSIPPSWAATTLTLDIGIYEAGAAHDGPEVDADLFANNLDGTSFFNYEDKIAATGLPQSIKGKALWEIVNVATPSTYTKNPQEFWDICFTVEVANAITVQDFLFLAAEYKSGGN